MLSDHPDQLEGHQLPFSPEDLVGPFLEIGGPVGDEFVLVNSERLNGKRFEGVPPGILVPYKSQPRQSIDRVALLDLIDRIRQTGQLHDIVVAAVVRKDQPNGPVSFLIMSGERRSQALRELGLNANIVVRYYPTEDELFKAALSANEGAEPLSLYEKACAYDRLFSTAQRRIARGEDCGDITDANVLAAQWVSLDKRVFMRYRALLKHADLLQQASQLKLSLSATEALFRQSEPIVRRVLDTVAQSSGTKVNKKVGSVDLTTVRRLIDSAEGDTRGKTTADARAVMATLSDLKKKLTALFVTDDAAAGRGMNEYLETLTAPAIEHQAGRITEVISMLDQLRVRIVATASEAVSEEDLLNYNPAAHVIKYVSCTPLQNNEVAKLNGKRIVVATARTHRRLFEFILKKLGIEKHNPTRNMRCVLVFDDLGEPGVPAYISSNYIVDAPDEVADTAESVELAVRETDEVSIILAKPKSDHPSIKNNLGQRVVVLSPEDDRFEYACSLLSTQLGLGKINPESLGTYAVCIYVDQDGRSDSQKVLLLTNRHCLLPVSETGSMTVRVKQDVSLAKEVKALYSLNCRVYLKTDGEYSRIVAALPPAIRSVVKSDPTFVLVGASGKYAVVPWSHVLLSE